VSLSDRVRSRRVEIGLKQYEVAEKLGMGRSNVGHIENGRTVPPADVLDKLADILKTTPDFLLGRTDDPNPKVKENVAFYGGGKDWTPEELEVAEAAIEAYRKMKNRRG